jgi:hypothetical protein
MAMIEAAESKSEEDFIKKTIDLYVKITPFDKVKN